MTVLVSTNSTLIGLFPVKAETAQVAAEWREQGFQFVYFLVGDWRFVNNGMTAFQKADEIQDLGTQMVGQGLGLLVDQFSRVNGFNPLLA